MANSQRTGAGILNTFLAWIEKGLAALLGCSDSQSLWFPWKPLEALTSHIPKASLIQALETNSLVSSKPLEGQSYSELLQHWNLLDGRDLVPGWPCYLHMVLTGRPVYEDLSKCLCSVLPDTCCLLHLIIKQCCALKLCPSPFVFSPWAMQPMVTDPHANDYPIFISVVVNFICQLGWAIMPGYLVKCYSGYF